jgi:hypothetical protein
MMVKIHKILKGGLNPIGFRIKVPWRAWLDFKGNVMNFFDHRISMLDLFLKPDCFRHIFFCFKRNTGGEVEMTRNPEPVQLLKTCHQGLIAKSVTLVDPFVPVQIPRPA